MRCCKCNRDTEFSDNVVSIDGEDWCGSCVEDEFNRLRFVVSKIKDWDHVLRQYEEFHGSVCLKHDSEKDEECEECRLDMALMKVNSEMQEVMKEKKP